MNNLPTTTVPTAILFNSCSTERERMKTFILNHQSLFLNLVGEYACPNETLQAIADCKPNLLFLSTKSGSTTPDWDIDKGMFLLINELYKTDFIPHIVITNPSGSSTSFTFRQVHYQVTARTHFFVKAVNGRTYQFETSSVAYIKSDGNCAVIYFLSGEVKNVTTSLSEMEQKLSSFVRIGRSHLINLNSVKSIDSRRRICAFTDEVSIVFNRNNLLFLKNYIENL